ncbi:hypothetical protein GCM10022222_59970 [Amycolatopsis ultiminotia]|uniref:Uncharacterized protein n=1 Tax=Amycolatopsis ultiminotia TaxID=543629 RepID=A0ABP6XPT9_9PSEU
MVRQRREMRVGNLAPPGEQDVGDPPAVTAAEHREHFKGPRMDSGASRFATGPAPALVHLDADACRVQQGSSGQPDRSAAGNNDIH